MTKPEISGIAPFFIVKNVPAALSFYRDRLGFDITFQGPAPDDIFFGIVQRGAAMIMFKDVGVDPLPNCTRDVKKGIWSHEGMYALANAHRDKVKLTFHHGAQLPDPKELFNAGLDGNKWRAIDFREGDKIDKIALKALLREAVAYNTTHSVPRSKGSRA